MRLNLSEHSGKINHSAISIRGIIMTQTRAVVRVTHAFSASSERVFDAWLDSKTAGNWLFNSPTGQIMSVEIDARVGGSFSIVRRDGNDDIDHVGEYLEIDKPRRLVFSFTVPKFAAEYSKVTIDIVTEGTGCELSLLHEDILPEWADPSRAGWTAILEALAKELG
jgi:uncharacterized protein YndB with AHSA1/START domain